MRRAILSFELPEDKKEYDLCNSALYMDGALRDIRKYLIRERDTGKYCDATDELIQQIFDYMV